MVKGTAPAPRDSHTCTTVGSRLFVFGGTDGTSPLKDLHILDTLTNQWITPVTRGEGPAAREGHSAALIGHRLFIFGGCGRSLDDLEETYYNDLHILDTNTLLWLKAATQGTAPAPRDSHTCSSYQNMFIVLGGEDSTNSYLSDIFTLDADTLVWKELRTSGQKLIPRAGHTTVALGKYLFVFGGFTDDRKLFDDLHILHLEAGVWTKSATTGEGPSPRFSLAGDCADIGRGYLFFLGGCNENLEALEDMYFLDTEMGSEVTLGDPKPEKLSLRKELKRKRQEQNMIPEKCKDGVLLDGVIPAPEGVSLYGHQEFRNTDCRDCDMKITEMFHYGYTVEANLDGKHLRGVLFSYQPGYYNAVHNHLTRKKLSHYAEEARLRELRKAERKEARQAKLAKFQSFDDIIPSHVSGVSFEHCESVGAIATSPLVDVGQRMTSPAHGTVQIAEEHV